MIRPVHGRSVLAAAALAALASPVCWAQGDAPANREERAARFASMMQGKHLEGQFSVSGPQGIGAPQADLYMVSELEKGEGESWIFTSKMSYGGANAIEIPVPVDVLWAGETPVITITDQVIEGLGTFTARVMLYEGLYAGTWQHGPVGGHMWGRLVDASEVQDPSREGSGAQTP